MAMTASSLAATLAEGFHGCQYVIVVPKSKYKSQIVSDGVNNIIALLLLSMQTVQYVDNGKYFNRYSYTFKHRETRVVFLVVPILYPKTVIDFTELDKKSRMGVYRFGLQSHRDMVVYLVDKSINPKAVKYKPAPVVVAGLCGLVANTLIIEYSARNDSRTGFKMRMLWLRVPGEHLPVCLREIVPSLEYDQLMQQMRDWRKNLGQLGVLFSSYPEIPEEFGSPSALVTQERSMWRQDRTLSQFMPYIHTALKLNFTLRPVPKYDTEGLFCTQGTIETGETAVDIGGDSDNSVVTIFLRGRTSDMLIFGADTDVQNPLYLPSVLTPFPWYFWLVLLAAILLNVAVIVRKSKRKDVGEAMISVFGPMVGQSPTWIPRGLYFWMFLWTLLVMYASNAYLGVLESLQIKPSVTVVKTTFQDLVDRNFSMYTNPYLAEYYKETFLENSRDTIDPLIWSIRTKKEWAEYKTLARLLEPTDFTNCTKAFWKLEHSALMENQKLVSVLQKVLLDKFEQNYHILKREFNSMPTWSWFNVPHGDGVLDVYKMLIDTGIDGYWNEVARTENLKLWVEPVGKFGGLWDPHVENESKESVQAVGLRESLVLEALFLYGVGVCLAVIGLLVNLLYGVCKYLAARWKNFRNTPEPKLFVRSNTQVKGRGPKVTHPAPKE